MRDVFSYLPKDLHKIIKCRDGKVSDIEILADKSAWIKQSGVYGWNLVLTADI